jgi:hypothetical protein
MLPGEGRRFSINYGVRRSISVAGDGSEQNLYRRRSFPRRSFKLSAPYRSRTSPRVSSLRKFFSSGYSSLRVFNLGVAVLLVYASVLVAVATVQSTCHLHSPVLTFR